MKKKSKGGKSKLESVALVFGGVAIAAVVFISAGNVGTVDTAQTAAVGSTWSIFVPSTWGM